MILFLKFIHSIIFLRHTSAYLPIVCFTDLILALEIPSRECALGLNEFAKSGKVEDNSIVEEDPEDNLIRGFTIFEFVAGSMRFLARRFLRILAHIFT